MDSLENISEEEFCKIYIREAIRCISEAAGQVVRKETTMLEYDQILDGILPVICITQTRLLNI